MSEIQETTKAEKKNYWRSASPRKKASILLVVIVVVTIFTFGYLLNPSVSPITTIHDADGDGYADDFDAKDNDALAWNYATGKIIVTISIDIGDWFYDYIEELPITVTIKLDGETKYADELHAGDIELINFNVSWYYGNISSKVFSVIGTATSENYPDVMDSGSVLLRPGGDTGTISIKF